MPAILLTHTQAARAQYFGASLAGLEALGAVRLHHGTEPLGPDALIEAAQGCDIVVADRATPGPARVFAMLPDLVAMVRVAVDIRNIDVASASQHGVLVTHASAGFMTAVAELVIGTMIDLSRGITDAALAYRQGARPIVSMGRQLAGSSIGIVGYGEIGRALGALALALGMEVRINDPYAGQAAPGITPADFATLLACSDFVVCLATAHAGTENLFDGLAFAAMRPGTHFINASRGLLVDEAALLSALDSGHLAGAALDVGRAPDEMPTPSLARHPRVLATPHIGGLTPQAVSHQSEEAVRQCAEIIAGRIPAGAANGPDARRLARLGPALPERWAVPG